MKIATTPDVLFRNPVLVAVGDLLEHGYITEETMQHITADQAQRAHEHINRMKLT